MDFLEKLAIVYEIAHAGVTKAINNVKSSKTYISIDDMMTNDDEISKILSELNKADHKFVCYLQENEDEFVEDVNKYGIELALANMRVKMNIGLCFTPKPTTEPKTQDEDSTMSNVEIDEEFSFKASFDINKGKGAFLFNWKKTTKKK
jgi:hypothetical protein